MRIFVSAFDCVDFMWDFSEILDFELKEARFCRQKLNLPNPDFARSSVQAAHYSVLPKFILILNDFLAQSRILKVKFKGKYA